MEFWKPIYLDADFSFCRKDHNLASSRGKRQSFLGNIKQNNSKFWRIQKSIFSEKEEYGLLNRLDHLTAGLLYFARNPEAKLKFQALQASWSIQKIYYAQVYGIPPAQFGWIRTPIYHHRQLSDRMTVDRKKGRNEQKTTSYRELLEIDKSGSKSWLKIIISQWVRHQIRVHLASIGHPILWDRLYMTPWLRKRFADDIDDKKIELVSAGVEIVSNV